MIWQNSKPVEISSLQNKLPRSNSLKIGRYFDCKGFSETISNKKLQFKDLAEFEDTYEGMPLYEYIRKSLITTRARQGESIYVNRLDKLKLANGSYYASCWTMNRYESALMWKNYVPGKNGVYLITSTCALLKALSIKCYEDDNGNLHNVFYGKVDYNYREVFNSDHRRAFCKQRYYKDEKEFRIVINIYPNIKELCQYIEIMNFDFIDEIIVSPYCNKEYLNEVKEICCKNSIKYEIVKESKLMMDTKKIVDEFIGSSK